ncbi:MAG: peptidylprolyl isomerase [Oscillospiraceae bacterium]|nr:peptidylprolyl isomerase [Oscillospiraceae bacterium]
MKKRIFALMLAALMAFVIIGCANGNNEQEAEQNLDMPTDAATTPGATEPPLETTEPPVSTEDLPETIQATITMEDGGVIVVELYPHIAPQSVFNFVYLARQGFYDGLVFHRIMSGFMIQGGCPDGTGGGSPGHTIFGEFADNGFENNLAHVRGVLSMARRGDDYNSAGSQFFIVHGDSQFLDRAYAGFGAVISGMDVVDRLAETPNDGPNGSVAPEDRPVIRTITIDDDIVLPLPDKIT